MNHLKTYEFFHFGKKSTNQVDIELLKDLVSSDLDDIRFRGVDIIEGTFFSDIYYRVNLMGNVKLKTDKWFGEDIKYAYTPDGNYQEFINRGLNTLGKVNSGNFKKGIGLFLNEQTFGLMDMRERFFAINKIFKQLNRNRFEEYNIKFSYYRLKYLDYGILFYND